MSDAVQKSKILTFVIFYVAPLDLLGAYIDGFHLARHAHVA
jgi:hypothetical protein